MKKIAYLLGLIIVLSIYITSCQKNNGDDNDDQKGLNQPNEYFGTWVLDQNENNVLDDNYVKLVLAKNVLEIFYYDTRESVYKQDYEYSNWSISEDHLLFYGDDWSYSTNNYTIVEVPNNVRMVLEYPEYNVPSVFLKQD
jgi:hypothetical protein